jgi:hypothetical protein
MAQTMYMHTNICIKIKNPRKNIYGLQKYNLKYEKIIFSFKGFVTKWHMTYFIVPDFSLPA